MSRTTIKIVRPDGDFVDYDEQWAALEAAITDGYSTAGGGGL